MKRIGDGATQKRRRESRGGGEAQRERNSLDVKERLSSRPSVRPASLRPLVSRRFNLRLRGAFRAAGKQQTRYTSPLFQPLYANAMAIQRIRVAFT